jgi:peptide alpha-N-acetyltransferase
MGCTTDLHLPCTTKKADNRDAAAQALKMLLAVVRHFGDFAEDQFDFHSYCVRKLTLRAYVAMLRMQDVLRSNAFFAKVGSAPRKFCGTSS